MSSLLEKKNTGGVERPPDRPVPDAVAGEGGDASVDDHTVVITACPGSEPRHHDDFLQFALSMIIRNLRHGNAYSFSRDNVQKPARKHCSFFAAVTVLLTNFQAQRTRRARAFTLLFFLEARHHNAPDGSRYFPAVSCYCSFCPQNENQEGIFILWGHGHLS